MLQRIFPCIQWMGAYDRANLRGDLVAGVTVAVLLIPQAMAYAMLAGLPPVHGLYASVFPLLAYALVGSSRHLAIGPTAIVSILVFAGCSALARPGSPEYIGYATVLALAVGVIQIALGLLKMGFLINFVSHAVVSGFTTGAAILICLAQMKHLLGVDVESGDRAIEIAVLLVHEIGETHVLTACLGVGSLIAVFIFGAKRKPGPLVAVVASTVLVYALRWDKLGVATVGAVPRGMPAVALPGINMESMRTLGPVIGVIAAISYMESMAFVQLIAAKERYRVGPNMELRAIGFANAVSALFQGYPVTGSFSRTAVNYHAGAKTGMAGLITAVLILPALLFLTPVFQYMPKAVLGAIIIVAAAKLIDTRMIRHLFLVDAKDGWTLVITTLTVLIYGIEAGIITGVVFSLVLFIWRSSHPHTAELGYIAHEGAFRDVERFPTAYVDPRALILRLDRSIYFANFGFIEDRLREAMAEKPDLEWVVLDVSGVNDVDGAAVHALEGIVERCEASAIRLMFAGMKGPVRDTFIKAGWDEHHHKDRLTYLTVEHAMEQTDLFDTTVWP